MAGPTSLRHYCGTQGSMASCSRGSGRGPKKCKYCGGRIVVEEGRYGVFVYRKDGRYPESEAVNIYASEKAAERLANSDAGQRGQYVVRWVRK